MKKCRYCGQDVPIRDHATYQDCIGILLRKIETLERQFTDWSNRASSDLENINADRWRYKKALDRIIERHAEGTLFPQTAANIATEALNG